MKNLRRPLAVLLGLLLILAFAAPAFAAEADAFTISNPYADVDWDTVRAYKTGLHSHTNASDGDQTLKESIERHYEAGFDIVSISDHGTVDYGWETAVPNDFIHTVLKTVKRSRGELQALGAAGVFGNGVSYTCAAAENGDDFVTTADGRTILRVPYAIEQNAVSVNAHVNSWFVDFHDNSISDYRDAVRGVDRAGGLCVINHPGEYTKARYEIRSAQAYNESDPVYRYYINKFASLIEKYDACIGIDINSKGDNRTRFDRILWDTLLRRFSANGENVFAIASSDAHQLSVTDTGFVWALMPELSSEALRASLSAGAFFPASHCLGNYEELRDIAQALKTYYGETALYGRVNAAAEALAARAAGIEAGELDADESLGETYSVLDEDGRRTVSTEPAVTAIRVDDDKNTIAIETRDALLVRWIADGKLIATQRADAAVLDLDEHAAALGNYVRAEVFGEGGVLYTQAFLLNAADNAGSARVTDPGFVDLGVLDFLFAEIGRWIRVAARFFRNLF